ncbi:MAG: D-glycero-beta-D-manno-heptose-7-phosphate kinase, partial [Kiritimatiellae bacterium]|nr:D-glycero-beta-D-manno-heptose-7-phosphate kinase [Kiritimatiellia bacterium]
MKKLLDKIATMHFLVVGDLMLDHYLWGDATRISPEAPVPVVKTERDTFTAGGA